MRKILIALLLVGLLGVNQASAEWSADLREGVVANYNFDESSGDLIDRVHNYYNGTMSGAYTRQETGIINEAYNLTVTGLSTVTHNSTFNTPSMAWNIWVYLEDITGRTEILGKRDPVGSDNGYVRMYVQDGWINNRPWKLGGGVESWNVSTTKLSLNTWHMITISFNDSTKNFETHLDKISIDNHTISTGINTARTDPLLIGESGGAGNNYKIFDELSVWNRSLSTANVLELYNDSHGLEYGIIFTDYVINTTYDSIIYELNSTNYTISVDVPNESGGIKNITVSNLKINDTTHTVFNSSVVSGNITNTTRIVDYGFNVASNNTLYNHNWTVLVEWVNGTNQTITTSDDSQNLYHSSFIISSDLPSQVLEGTINMNFSSTIGNLNPLISENVTHEWNGTNYTLDGLYYNLINVSLVSADTNVTYRTWLNSSYDGDYRISSTSEANQTILNLALTSGYGCSNPVLNISFIDEFTAMTTENLTRMDIELLFTGVDTDTVFGLAETNVTNITICMTPTYGVANFNAEIEYSNSTTPIRKHFLFNASLSNTTQELNLYTLIGSSVTNVSFEVVDDVGIALENYYIIAQKNFLSNNTFVEVVMAKTNFEGKTFMNMELFKDYIFVIRNLTHVVDTKSKSTINLETIQLPVNPSQVLDYFNDYNLVTYIWTDSNITNTTTVVLTAIDGITKEFNFVVTELSLLGSTVICDDTTSGTSVTMNCYLGDINDKDYEVKVTYDSEEIFVFKEYLSYPDLVTDTGILFAVVLLNITIAVVMSGSLAGATVTILLVNLILADIGLLPVSQNALITFVALGLVLLIKGLKD